MIKGISLCEFRVQILAVSGCPSRSLPVRVSVKPAKSASLFRKLSRFHHFGGCTLRHRDAPCARESPYSVFNAWRTSVIGSGKEKRDDDLEISNFHLTLVLARTRCSSQVPGKLAEK